MSKKDLKSAMQLCVLTSLVLFMCFVYSCKKSSTESPTETKEQHATKAPVKTTDEMQEKSAQQEQAVDEETSEEEVAEEEPIVEELETVPEPESPKLVPVEIDLPKPMFVGTPQDTRVPNLEKPLGKPRPPFLAPAGTTNVAFGKPVSSSDEEPIIGEIEYVTDGDKEAADGSFVELGPFLQHVTIDLEQACEIYAIVVWHYHKQPRVYYDVVVQVSDDSDFISNVKTVFNNDMDNSAGLGVGKNMHYTETAEGKLIDCLSQGPVRCQYVRLYSKGNTSNDLNHYIEVEVYGKPIE
jgi:hypothetical protein